MNSGPWSRTDQGTCWRAWPLVARSWHRGTGDPTTSGSTRRRGGRAVGWGAWEPGYEGGAGGPVPVCTLSCCVAAVGSLPMPGLAPNRVSGPKGPNLGSVDP